MRAYRAQAQGKGECGVHVDLKQHFLMLIVSGQASHLRPVFHWSIL